MKAIQRADKTVEVHLVCHWVPMMKEESIVRLSPANMIGCVDVEGISIDLEVVGFFVAAIQLFFQALLLLRTDESQALSFIMY